MSYKKLSPFIVKVSVLGYFPLHRIDLIIFYNVPKRFCIYHNLLQSLWRLPKQHTFT